MALDPVSASAEDANSRVCKGDEKTQEERRQYKRRRLDATVRFTASNNPEATGRLHDISEGGLFMATNTDARVGDEVIAYPEGLGRLEGVVVRKDEKGVAVQFNISEAQRETLARRIDSAEAGVPYFRLSDRRGQKRRKMNIEAEARIVGKDAAFRCRVVDISYSGAAILCRQRPPKGAEVKIGALEGRVSRHTVDGFVLVFASYE